MLMLGESFKTFVGYAGVTDDASFLHYVRDSSDAAGHLGIRCVAKASETQD